MRTLIASCPVSDRPRHLTPHQLDDLLASRGIVGRQVEARPSASGLRKKLVYFSLRSQPVVFRRSVLKAPLFGAGIRGVCNHPFPGLGRDLIRRCAV